MNHIVAFVENGQAYVLPAATGDNGIAVTSQPKFVQEKEAHGYPKLNWSKVNQEWAQKYIKSGFVSSLMKQQLYVWWMKLTAAEKVEVFENATV